MQCKNSLRARMRALRSALDHRQRNRAALSLQRTLRKHPLFQKAKTIAGYVPRAGELDPLPLLRQACNLGKKVYLPVLQDRELRFAPYQPGATAMRVNRYGIPEPRTRLCKHVGAGAIDLMLVPLVAFDTRGGRLGMGGGYYDRTLAFKRRRHVNSPPILIGLGYSFQKVDRVPVEPWDVPLAGVATERRVSIVNSPGRSSSTKRRIDRSSR